METAFGPGDRLPWPIAGVLTKTGKSVEDSALAGVGVASERHDIVPVLHIDT